MMHWRKWEDLPEKMQVDEVKDYYAVLEKKRVSLFCKRVFDVVVSLLMLVILSPLFLVLAIAIKVESKGPVFFRQVRITQYGKEFRIHKFRSMVQGADKGAMLTVGNDSRITKVGKFIRKYRLDEISQLLDVLQGTMSFVGTRPEVPKYVDAYNNEMLATLLLPAGVTGESSIFSKDDDKVLEKAEDIDKVYIEKLLPEKMQYNLRAIKNYSFWGEIKIMFMTFFSMLGKEYYADCAPGHAEKAVAEK